MKIVVGRYSDYEKGIYPEVTEIYIRRGLVSKFFKGNRFPNLVRLDCDECSMEELELDCPSLKHLCCSRNQLTELRLNCPSLLQLFCSSNRLTILQLDCPSLRVLDCSGNPLAELNGLEFCADLTFLICSKNLEESTKFLEVHLPGITIDFT